MDLKHNKVSQSEAAENLRVKINNELWIATQIAIVRRESEGPQWVNMTIVDHNSGIQFEYFVERPGMIKAWIALDMGCITSEHIDNLIVELNGKMCTAIDVTSLEEGSDEWIQMDIRCLDGITQSMAIERQSMIDAYYALRLSIEDRFETGIEAITGLFTL